MISLFAFVACLSAVTFPAYMFHFDFVQFSFVRLDHLGQTVFWNFPLKTLTPNPTFVYKYFGKHHTRKRWIS
jgi:hypothetical protein